MDTTNLLNEAILDVQARRKRAIATKRREPQLKRAREIAARKLAPEETLMRRARLRARDILRKKFAGKQGENYHDLAPAARVQVDKMIEKRLPAIERMVKRLLPQIRKEERERLKKRQKAKAAGQAATSSTISMVNNRIPIREYVELAEEVLVDGFIEYIVDVDYSCYDRVIPSTVAEDIAVNSIVTDASQMDAIVDQLSVGYPIHESVSLEALSESVQSQYITMYHPDKLHYHVELVRLGAGDMPEDQPAIQERLRQGYVIVTPKSSWESLGAHTSANNRKYHRQIDD